MQCNNVFLNHMRRLVKKVLVWQQGNHSLTIQLTWPTDSEISDQLKAHLCLGILRLKIWIHFLCEMLLNFTPLRSTNTRNPCLIQRWPTLPCDSGPLDSCLRVLLCKLAQNNIHRDLVYNVPLNYFVYQL